MVQLHLNGKRKCDIIREYDISGALLDKWIKQSTTTGSFREKDNRSEMEQELIELRKRNKQLEMENDILKQAALIQKSKRHSWTKIAVIKNNVHKYSVSAMCSVLQISRSTYYYESKEKAVETKLTAEIKRIFRESRNNYGTRKIKKELDKLEWQVSRRRIGRIMKQEGLVSNYTVAQYKPHVDKCNESKIANVVNRQFKNQPEYNVVVSDLTYVRVGMSWNW